MVQSQEHVVQSQENVVQSQENMVQSQENMVQSQENMAMDYGFSIKKALLSITHLLVYYSICLMTSISTCAKYLKRDLTKVLSILC